MSGNILEWCLDWYADMTKGQLPSETIDPVGPAQGDMRVCRGGFWNCSKGLGYSADRFSNFPDFGYAFDGFRVVITLPGPQPRCGGSSQ